jgi:hypothetical protein
MHYKGHSRRLAVGDRNQNAPQSVRDAAPPTAIALPRILIAVTRSSILLFRIKRLRPRSRVGLGLAGRLRQYGGACVGIRGGRTGNLIAVP